MVYAVAVLLISSLTTVGLIAVWAATSPGNWFWRTMAFLGAMSPLLLIPAYEPFVAFVIQGAVVAAGVTLVPWRDSKKGEPPAFSRYSLRTILALIVPIAIVAAATCSAPQLNRQAWQSIIVIGLCAGFTTIAGWWAATRQASRWSIRSILALTACALTGYVLARTDWFIVCLDNLADWPPNVAETNWGFWGDYGKDDRVNIWYFVLAAQILFTNYLLQEHWLAFAVIGKRLHPNRWMSRAITLGFVTVVALGPCLFMGFRLLNRYPIPNDKPPNPNGFNDFLTACKLMPAVRLIDNDQFNPWEAKEAELRQVSDELTLALEKVDEGLTKPTWINVDFYELDDPQELLHDFISLRWGICMQGRLAETQGDYGKAAERYLASIAFASARSRGGLVIHDQFSCGSAEVGLRLLYLCIEKLRTKELPQYIERLRVLDSEYEPAENYVYRSEVNIQRCRGWFGHLVDIFGTVFQPRYYQWNDYIADRTILSTISRLMQTELALRAYKADHNAWPSKLSDLVPEYLPEIPIDPCSLENDTLRYKRNGDRFIVYSVGHNRVDDQGEESSQSLSYAMHGDIWLEDWFCPWGEDEPPASLASPDGDADQE